MDPTLPPGDKMLELQRHIAPVEMRFVSAGLSCFCPGGGWFAFPPGPGYEAEVARPVFGQQELGIFYQVQGLCSVKERQVDVLFFNTSLKFSFPFEDTFYFSFTTFKT